MNKTVLYAIIGLVVVAAGGGAAYFLIHSNTPLVAELPAVPGGTISAGPTTRVRNASLGDLIDLGVQTPQLCATVAGALPDRSAQVAVADGKLRADTAPIKKSDGGTSHLILNGTDAYAWSDNAKYGFKMSQGAAGTTSSSLGANERADYDCTPTTFQGKPFSPPTDVIFGNLRDVYGDVCLELVPICPVLQMPTCSNGGWVCGDTARVTAGFSFTGGGGGGGTGSSGGGSGGEGQQSEEEIKEAYCAAACANAPEPQCRSSLGCD